MEPYRDFLGLGIAGNFALHLEQAGELEDFKDLDITDESAPKGIFPFYLKNSSSQLGIYPLSSSTIQLPKDCTLNVQAEPEVALLCDIIYKDGLVDEIVAKKFAPYNDCSIRREGATKISQKKNWGSCSKGISDTLIDIDSFSSGGIMDSWRIVSYLRRDAKLHQYGEDVALLGYSFFHTKLLEWIKKQLNTQKDVGPLEPIGLYLKQLNYPKQALISIGATRYTSFGESEFLQDADEIIVALYDTKVYRQELIEDMIKTNSYSSNSCAILAQRVIS